MKSPMIILMTLLIAATGCARVSRLFRSGGTEFVVRIETDREDKADMVDRAIKVFESKMNAIGVDGEAGKSSERPDEVTVRVYGNDDIERIRSFLFTTHQLELKKAVSPPNPSPLRMYSSEADARSDAGSKGQVLPYQEGSYNSRPQFIVVEPDAVIAGDDIRTAEAIEVRGSLTDYTIMFTLKPDSAARFGTWTERNIGNYLAVVLDGKVVSAPSIQGRITDTGQINGRFTKTSAEELAASLKSGYLPVKISVLDERKFGN